MPRMAVNTCPTAYVHIVDRDPFAPRNLVLKLDLFFFAIVNWRTASGVEINSPLPPGASPQ